MKTIRSHYLDDGRAFNQGQAASLIEIECDEDFELLLQYIIDSDFYGREYLARQSGQGDERLVGHFWWVAEMVAMLSPRLVLEIGCGRGDVLRLLREAHDVDVVGVDFGSAVSSMLWPSLRGSFHAGDVLEVLRDWPGRPYDIACGFDIWEHLLPSTLDDTIAALISHATDDALFVFVIPAFGDDTVFHEQFPLEFEENRDAFDRREPFRFLVTDAADEKVPAAGHLTWAHTDWWVQRFEEHGLVRETRLERFIHPVVDAHVPHSVQAFYVFRRPTLAAEQRVDLLSPRRVPAASELAMIVRRDRYQRKSGATFSTSVGDEFDCWMDSHAGRLAPLSRRARSALAPVLHRKS